MIVVGAIVHYTEEANSSDCKPALVRDGSGGEMTLLVFGDTAETVAGVAGDEARGANTWHQPHAKDEPELDPEDPAGDDNPPADQPPADQPPVEQPAPVDEPAPADPAPAQPQE